MAGPAELQQRVAKILPEITALRHSLHRIPETHFQERETARVIRDFLKGSAVEVLPPLLETDTIGLLRGRPGGRCILFRSDIDALPVQDRSGAPWSSERPGRSHACGHDGHMAILLGTARVLEQFAGDLAGNVRFVFQPAEEEAAGGKALIAKGLLELEPRAEMAFALHGWPGVPEGFISCAPGHAMAAADTFRITIRGRGGHAASPHRAADPVVTAAQVVTALQTVVSRSVDPLEAAVLSICRIQGGHTSNVIPDEVVLEGTTRYFESALLPLMRERMEHIVAGVCGAAGCTYELAYEEGYVALVNHESAVDLARRVVTSRLGPDRWAAAHPRSMTAEDFAYYLERLPGALLRLGLGEQWQPLHGAGFDFNDRAIEPGIVTLAGLALDFCGR